MIIPSKHSGYQAGIRLYPGGGGDGSGGQGDPTGNADPSSNPSTQADSAGSFGGGRGGLFGNNAGGLFGPVNTGGLSGYVDPSGARSGGFDGGGYGGDINNNNNNTVVKKTQPTNTTAGTSTIDPNNPSLRAIGWAPYNQSGQYYNTLLQQGYAGNDIRNALTTQGKPISDSNYEALVQNAGMVSPTGRPMAGSDQFTQPVYNSQYQNYARPSTQFSTSLYGTQPMNSPAFNSGMSRRDINNTIGSFSKANPNADASTTIDFMRNSGINREDFQAYGGLNNYGPQMSAPSMQAQQSFNPYTNGPQQQYNPFSYQQPQSMGYADPYSGRATGLGNRGSYGGSQQFVQPQMNNPFSYQPQQQQQFRPGQSIEYPQQQQFNPYRQYEMSLGSYNPYEQQQQYSPFSYQQQQYNPYQMQSPFSFQQPSYGGYGGYGGGNFIPDAPLSEGMVGTMGGTGYDPVTGRMDLGTAGGSGQYTPAPPRSSGPSQAIYGRSSGARGTPNVMRRAEGGIAGILKK